MDRLLRLKDVADLEGVSPRHILKLVASGRHPQPIRLGRSVRWRASDVAHFIEIGGDMAKFAATRDETRAAGRR